MRSMPSHSPRSIAGASEARLAPSEKGSRACQMTSPANSRSARVDRAVQSVEHAVGDGVHLASRTTRCRRRPRGATSAARRSRRSSFRGPAARRARPPETPAGDTPAATSARRTRRGRDCRRRLARARRRPRRRPCHRPMRATASPRASVPLRDRIRSTRRRRASRPPARSRTGPAASRNPSGWRDRRRAHCRRSRPDDARRNGTRRGGSPTGTAPADGSIRAAGRIARSRSGAPGSRRPRARSRRRCER